MLRELSQADCRNLRSVSFGSTGTHQASAGFSASRYMGSVVEAFGGPYLAKFYGASLDGEPVYLVMEYMSGGDLERYLRRADTSCFRCLMGAHGCTRSKRQELHRPWAPPRRVQAELLLSVVVLSRACEVLATSLGHQCCWRSGLPGRTQPSNSARQLEAIQPPPLPPGCVSFGLQGRCSNTLRW